MGPDVALAVTGIVLAGPGLSILFRDFGAYIVKKVDTIKNAPKLVLELQNVGRAFCEGRLQANLEIAENAFEFQGLRDELRADLVRSLEKMRHELLQIDDLLHKLVGENRTVNRFKLAMPPLWTWRTDAKRIIRNFDKSQSNFQVTINIVERCHQASVQTLLPLSVDKYKPRVKPDGSPYTPLVPNSHISMGSAEIRDKEGNPISTKIIIEHSNESSRELVPIIASHLTKNKHQTGLLKCLGYHGNENSYLVFQQPEGFGSPSTLHATMLKTPSNENPGGGHPLEYRLRLAHLVSISVLSVFSRDFVHKNIRPGTILLLRPVRSDNMDQRQSLVSAEPYLIYWTMLRKASDLSSLRGETSWVRDIYRHPQRAGLQPQERYNIRHDIYSLGVCLLEIGLWESLVVTKRDTDALLVDPHDAYDVSQLILSDMYQAVAVGLQLIGRDQVDSIDVLTKPSFVMKVLVELARRELPQRMRTPYADVVVSCLTCFEEGLGEDTDFEGDSESAALKFKMVVVEALALMY